MTSGRTVELVGASLGPVKVEGSMVQTSVKVDPSVRDRISSSLAEASETALPDRVFLHLENVRGTPSAAVLGVYLNLPADAKPSDHPELFAGSVGLFGLRGATAPHGRHGGQGLSFTLEITKIVDALYLENMLNLEALPVTVVSSTPLQGPAPITIGRISVYRKGR